MAEPRLKPKQPAPAPVAEPPQRTLRRPARPDPDSVAALIAEAERIMGVEPIQTSRPLPGY